MAVTLTGTGGLFTRLGLMAGGAADLNGMLGTTAPSPGSAWGSGGPTITAFGTRVDNLAAQFNTNQQNLRDGLYGNRDSFRQTCSQWKSALSQLAAATLQEMVQADIIAAGASASLPLPSVQFALNYLYNQMVANSNTVTASVVAAGAQTAVGTPNGNAQIVMSVKLGNGRTAELSFPEVLTFLCTADSQSGGTLNQEQMAVSGVVAQSDLLAFDWPYGSGLSGKQVPTVDASQNNTGGNLLTNSCFPTFTTTNVADNWSSITGVAGTDFGNGTGTTFDGVGSLKFIGGATNTKLYQAFNTPASVTVNAGGTPATLLPSTQYQGGCWIYASVTPAAGVLEFALTDAADAVLNDMQAVANTFTKSLTAVTTTWIPINFSFRTPAVMPAGYRLRIRLSTALSAGTNLFVSRLGFTPATSLYTGGPQASIFSGSTKLINGLVPDSWTVAITNTYGKFQQWAYRFFQQQGFLFPSAVSGSISDTLVT